MTDLIESIKYMRPLFGRAIMGLILAVTIGYYALWEGLANDCAAFLAGSFELFAVWLAARKLKI